MNVDKLRFFHELKESIPVERQEFKKPNFKTYVVVDPANGLTKIGRSTHYEDRIRSLKAQLKCDLLVISVINGDHEAKLHKLYKSKWVLGEWFQLDFDDHIYLRSIGHVQ